MSESGHTGVSESGQRGVSESGPAGVLESLGLLNRGKFLNRNLSKVRWG